MGDAGFRRRARSDRRAPEFSADRDDLDFECAVRRLERHRFACRPGRAGLGRAESRQRSPAGSRVAPRSSRRGTPRRRHRRRSGARRPNLRRPRRSTRSVRRSPPRRASPATGGCGIPSSLGRPSPRGNRRSQKGRRVPARLRSGARSRLDRASSGPRPRQRGADAPGARGASRSRPQNTGARRAWMRDSDVPHAALAFRERDEEGGTDDAGDTDGQDLDGRRARQLGRRDDPRPHPHAALRDRCVRRDPRLSDERRTGRLPTRRAPPALRPFRATC